MLFFSLSRPKFRSFFLSLSLGVFSWNCGRGSKPWPTKMRVSAGVILCEPRRPTMDQQKIGDKTFGFLIVLDCATSHLAAYPCKTTSPSSGVISKLHEWMNTSQMNAKAICADMAFHHPHDMQAFHRLHNEKRLPIGPHTPWPNRVEMGARFFKIFLFFAFVDTAF